MELSKVDEPKILPASNHPFLTLPFRIAYVLLGVTESALFGDLGTLAVVLIAGASCCLFGYELAHGTPPARSLFISLGSLVALTAVVRVTQCMPELRKLWLEDWHASEDLSGEAGLTWSAVKTVVSAILAVSLSTSGLYLATTKLIEMGDRADAGWFEWTQQQQMEQDYQSSRLREKASINHPRLAAPSERSDSTANRYADGWLEDYYLRQSGMKELSILMLYSGLDNLVVSTITPGMFVLPPAVVTWGDSGPTMNPAWLSNCIANTRKETQTTSGMIEAPQTNGFFGRSCYVRNPRLLQRSMHGLRYIHY